MCSHRCDLHLIVSKHKKTSILPDFLLHHFKRLKMVPGAGLEPARLCGRGILNPLCLPISPPGHERHHSVTMQIRQGNLELYADFSSNYFVSVDSSCLMRRPIFSVVRVRFIAPFLQACSILLAPSRIPKIAVIPSSYSISMPWPI